MTAEPGSIRTYRWVPHGQAIPADAIRVILPLGHHGCHAVLVELPTRDLDGCPGAIGNPKYQSDDGGGADLSGDT